ncbi:MAG: polymer-forming cytoskeletal protein, partial [Candidatus Sulfotelmatobacter sp.]
APKILIRGRVDGNLYGRESVDLKKSAVLVGDIYTPRIVIEDGAYLKGNVRSQEDIASPQTEKEGNTTAAKNLDLVSSARREDNT